MRGSALAELSSSGSSSDLDTSSDSSSSFSESERRCHWLRERRLHQRSMMPSLGPVALTPNRRASQSSRATHTDPMTLVSPLRESSPSSSEESSGIDSCPCLSDVEAARVVPYDFIGMSEFPCVQSATVCHRSVATASVRQSVTLSRLPLELLRLACAYLPVRDLLCGAAPAWRRLHSVVFGSSARPDDSFSRQRWEEFLLREEQETFGSVPVDGTDDAVSLFSHDDPVRLVMSAHHTSVHATIAKWSPGGSLSKPPSWAQHASHTASFKALHYLAERQDAHCVFPSKAGKVRVRWPEEPREKSDEEELLLANDVAQGISAAYCCGLPVGVSGEHECTVAFRRGIATNDPEANHRRRRGFGVLFPLFRVLPKDSSISDAEAAFLQSRGYDPAHPPVIGAGSCVVPFYTSFHLELYWWMLRNFLMSDVQWLLWPEDSKLAFCATVLSPFGGAAAELRFFTSSLQGSYPRFYAKCFFSAARAFPKEEISDTFSADGKEIFCGGYGRVEVDVMPRVSLSVLQEMAQCLRLPEDFPLPLLFNVVVASTGCMTTLERHMPMLMLYYRLHTFTDALAVQLQRPAGTFPLQTQPQHEPH